MIRVREIEHRIAQQHHQLLVLSPEQSGQRLLTSLLHDPFSHPLPKLSLRGPKLFPVAADHERSFLFALLLFIRLNIHVDTPLPLRGSVLRGPHTYPVGKPLLRGSIELSNRQTDPRHTVRLE
jgi:hypothetical protein